MIDYQKTLAKTRIIYITNIIESIEASLRDRIGMSQDPGFLAYSFFVKELENSASIDMQKISLYGTYICTNGAYSLEYEQSIFLEKVEQALQQEIKDIEKGAAIHEVFNNMLDIVIEEIKEDEEAKIH